MTTQRNDISQEDIIEKLICKYLSKLTFIRFNISTDTHILRKGFQALQERFEIEYIHLFI